MYTLEHVVDPLLEEQPDWPDAAVPGRRAPRFFDRVTHAMQVERRQLRCGDDRAHADLGSRPGERISTVRAARAAYDVRTAQPKEDLLDVIGGETLQGRDLSAGDRPFGRAAREV